MILVDQQGTVVSRNIAIADVESEVKKLVRPHGFNSYGLTSNNVGKTLADLPDPARIICFADTAQVNTFQPPASSSHPMIEEWYYVTYKTTEPADVHFRHNGRANAEQETTAITE